MGGMSLQREDKIKFIIWNELAEFGLDFLHADDIDTLTELIYDATYEFLKEDM